MTIDLVCVPLLRVCVCVLQERADHAENKAERLRHEATEAKDRHDIEWHDGHRRM